MYCFIGMRWARAPHEETQASTRTFYNAISNPTFNLHFFVQYYSLLRTLLAEFLLLLAAFFSFAVIAGFFLLSLLLLFSLPMFFAPDNGSDFFKTCCRPWLGERPLPNKYDRGCHRIGNECVIPATCKFGCLYGGHVQHCS